MKPRSVQIIQMIGAKMSPSSEQPFSALLGCGGPHLSHRDSTDAGVQNTSVGVGTHLTHKGEPLLPANRVLPHLLSAGEGRKGLFWRDVSLKKNASLAHCAGFGYWPCSFIMLQAAPLFIMASKPIRGWWYFLNPATEVRSTKEGKRYGQALSETFNNLFATGHSARHITFRNAAHDAHLSTVLWYNTNPLPPSQTAEEAKQRGYTSQTHFRHIFPLRRIYYTNRLKISMKDA